MATNNEPTLNAATNRIAHRLKDIVAPAQASPTTPVITKDAMFKNSFDD